MAVTICVWPGFSAAAKISFTTGTTMSKATQFLSVSILVVVVVANKCVQIIN